MYDIWYCPEYPVDAIRVSTRVRREGRELWRPTLLESIRQRGLVNPLIVLNHRGDTAEHHWLMVGTNRHWAVVELGWKTVPVLVTGICEYDPKEQVTWDTIQSYIKDGRIVKGTWGPVMRDNSLPHKGQYPSEI